MLLRDNDDLLQLLRDNGVPVRGGVGKFGASEESSTAAPEERLKLSR